MADVNITFTIPEAKVPSFRAGFLKVHPVPLDEETGEPTMGEAAWFKERVRKWVVVQVHIGNRQIAEEAVTPDPDDDVIL